MLAETGFCNVRVSTQGINFFEIIHALCRGKSLQNEREQESNETGEPVFNRVETGYELNAVLSNSASRQAIKNLLNDR
ncbi:MAG: hypothetical protein M3367_06705 [Acidobacteriota bacterium]|nr:hypothetical protein [Acidobacteriota bacterium]